MPAVKDYYDVLGVSRSASQKEIAAAFRKLARKLHPDANPGDKQAEERFKELSQAHEALADPEKRKLYDRYGADWQAARAAGATGAGPGPGPSSTYRTVSPEEFEDLFGDGAPFGDVLGSIFGSRSAAGTRSRRRPLEVEGTIEISLREAFSGTTRTLETPDGRRVEVKIPAGVAAGTVLRVPGIRARVEIAPDPQFKQDGNDLSTEVTVPLAVALKGGEVEVPTPRGTAVNLTVPPLTQNGTRLRLRGLGMPDPKGGTRGNLYAEVKVRLPLPPDPATKSWIDQMPAPS